MEYSGTGKGVFFDTKKLDSELMVRCLQAILNNLPNFQFTFIRSDEKFLGYRVHFSSPDEESVLKNELRVSGQIISICLLKTFLSIQIFNKTKEGLSKSEIEDTIGNRFGKLLDISCIYVPGTCAQKAQVIADIPEIKAQEKFQGFRNKGFVLTASNKNSKLKITLGCMLCKKDGHIARDCNQVSATVRRQTSNDGESVLTDSTMKMDFNIESTEAYTEKTGREKIMKTDFFSKDSFPRNKNTPEIKKFKKEPEFHRRAGVSGQNSPVTSDILSTSRSDEDEDEDIPIPIPFPNELAYEEYTDEESNHLTELPSTASPVPSVKKWRSQAAATMVEDMSILSEFLQECIDNALKKFPIIDKNELQAFFHHVKKKVNVHEVATKYARKPIKLKELLQDISKSYYKTTQKGTKEDSRFIKWLEERIEKFDRKVPQKRKNELR